MSKVADNTPEWSDASGWNDVASYSTMKVAVARNDLYLLARTDQGVDTWRFDTADGTWSKVADNTPEWSDASGWNDVTNYSTMNLAVARNDLYLLARTDQGVDTWRFDTADGTWSKVADNTPEWSDSSGWNDVTNYSTMKVAVARNDLYLLARTDQGVDTWRLDEPPSAPPPQAIPSRGVYRIPYQNGLTVEVRQDHLTHDPFTRIDMRGRGQAPHQVVAAADGVVRFVVDSFSENRPGRTPCNNNYVWIEHPNGEWTKYSHLAQSSVTEVGVSVGDRVRAGRILGIEGDVGCANGTHLHFEVAVPIDPSDPIDGDGFIRGGSRRNRIPWICGIPGATLTKGEILTASPCDPLVLVPSVLSFGQVPVGDVRTRRFTIANTTGDVLRVRFRESTTGAFRWAAFDQQIPNGSRVEVEVHFHPLSTNPVTGAVTINSLAPGNPHRVTLAGKGTGGFEPM